MTLKRTARRFFVRAQDEQFLPETILVSDQIPSVCRQRSWFSEIKRWLEKMIQSFVDFVGNFK